MQPPHNQNQHNSQEAGISENQNDPLAQFFRRSNFASASQALKFNSCPFTRGFRDTYTVLFHRYKRTVKLDRTDGYFLKSSWSRLTVEGAVSYLQTLLALFPNLNLEKDEKLKQAIPIIGYMGFGQPQIIERSEKALRLRIYNSLEDTSYLENQGRAQSPITAFSGGFMIGALAFSYLSINPNTAAELAKSPQGQKNFARQAIMKFLQRVVEFQQDRCQAEDGAFSEFNIILQ